MFTLVFSINRLQISILHFTMSLGKPKAMPLSFAFPVHKHTKSRLKKWSARETYYAHLSSPTEAHFSRNRLLPLCTRQEATSWQSVFLTNIGRDIVVSAVGLRTGEILSNTVKVTKISKPSIGPVRSNPTCPLMKKAQLSDAPIGMHKSVNQTSPTHYQFLKSCVSFSHIGIVL